MPSKTFFHVASPGKKNYIIYYTYTYRYQDGQHERKTRAKRRTEYVETGKKIWEKEMAERHECLVLDRQRDMERRAREKVLLAEFTELRNRLLMEKANEFRKQLDEQCVS